MDIVLFLDGSTKEYPSEFCTALMQMEEIGWSLHLWGKDFVWKSNMWIEY